MSDFDLPYFQVKLIPAADAWRRFDDWRFRHAEIGVLFVATQAVISSVGTVQSVGNGMLRIQSATAAAGVST